MAKQIHKYDQDNGNYLDSYSAITEAADKHGVHESSIRKAAKFGYASSGYLWSAHKRANYYDTDVVDDFLTLHNIPPEEVIKTRVQETKDGVRISVETKRTPELSDEDLRINALTARLKQLQRKTDELRVLKKEFRENSRIENTLLSLNEALVDILTKQTFKPITYQYFEESGPVIVIQLSDLHFNELVQLPDNYFGFEAGAKRLQKYASKIRNIADAYNCKNFVIAMTGDLINSDRRLDEMMNQATNRMKAATIATRILFHFINEINHLGNITILGVSGNESRVKEEFGMSSYVMSDNYDYLIFNMLKLLYKDSKGITFIDGDPVEQVININGSNILINHGTSIKEGQAYMQQVFGKYASKGILLDYAIFGHVHFTNITDIYSRSGSLVGNNVYSDRSLNLVTKASQVIHIIEKDGSIDSHKVNLQYYDGYQGYDIKDDLTAYNSQLNQNAREKEVIVQVVI